jgi:hypothetical protein
MPKQFVTELDIEDMVKRGITSLDLSDDLVLTELAIEMAKKLGVQLKSADATSPGIPLRPYLSQMPKTTAPKPAVEPPSAPLPTQSVPCALCAGKQSIKPEELKARIRKVAVAKMGDQMDAGLIDTIIDRVLDNIGIK